MKLINKSLLFAAAIAFAVVATSCGKYGKKGNSHTSGTTTIVCDNTFQNIMQQEIDVFEYQYDEAHILARYATQAEAFDSLMSLNTKTIVASRDITQRERDILKGKNRTVRSAKIAVDAVALIVNPENPVNKLSMSELKDIFSGETKNWNDIYPTDIGDIIVVFDDQNSSLVNYMRDSLLNGNNIGANVYAQGSIPEVFKRVREYKNAIGVVGVSWITSDLSTPDMEEPQEADLALAEARKDSLAEIILNEEKVESNDLSEGLRKNKIKVLALYNDKLREDEPRAYKPFQQNIYDGKYPLFRQIYMITTGASGSLAIGFYSFVTGEIGQKIIAMTGIMPARLKTLRVEYSNRNL